MDEFNCEVSTEKPLPPLWKMKLTLRYWKFRLWLQQVFF